MLDLITLPQLDSYPPPPMPCPWDPVTSAGAHPGAQLASSEVYPGCESDSSICMHSGYYSNGGEGHAPTFVDPAGCNPTYQSCAELRAADGATTVSLADPSADDFVWQKGYAWCATTPEASSGCAVYNAQAGGGEELAVLPTVPQVPASGVQGPSKPGPGHLLLCGHALLFGAVMATVNAAGDEDWQTKFETNSAAAADSMTPVGGSVVLVVGSLLLSCFFQLPCLSARCLVCKQRNA
jgi:hypothetical protein